MHSKTLEERRAENMQRFMEGMKDFARDMCAFVAINGFIAMLVLWYIISHTPAPLVILF